MHHQSLTEWPWFHRCNTESEWYQIHENIIKKLNARYNLTGSNAGEYMALSDSLHLSFQWLCFICLWRRKLSALCFSLYSLPKSAWSACWYVSLLYDRFIAITLKDIFFMVWVKVENLSLFSSLGISRLLLIAENQMTNMPRFMTVVWNGFDEQK